MDIDIEKIKKEKSVKELLEFGIINIDKPSGPTSFDVSDFVRKKLGLRKTSHFGTLDPMVTGVLPIALNRACKLTGFFLGEDKEYVGIMRIHEDVPLKEIEKMIKEKFFGKITQMPPVKSRVKRQEREREIKSFKILERNGQDIVFSVECQGGTYIRKLVHDLGLRIGGAHMTELRRIKAGIFSEEDSNFINLYDFEKAVSEYKEGNESSLRRFLIPAEQAIKKIMLVVQIKEESLKQLLTGKPLMEQDLTEKEKLPEKLPEERFAVFFGEKFIGVYKKSEEKDKGIIARAEFVLN